MPIDKNIQDKIAKEIEEGLKQITPKVFKKAAKAYTAYVKEKAAARGAVVHRISITPEEAHFRLRLKTDKQNISTVIGFASFNIDDFIGHQAGILKIDNMLNKLKTPGS